MAKVKVTGCMCEGGCERDAEPNKKLCRWCIKSGCIPHPVGTKPEKENQ